MINLAEALSLTRNLGVFDCESTGINPEQDRIVQIAITMHYPNKPPVSWQSYVNPTIPIPPEATDIHHITDEMVASALPFAAMAPKLAKSLSNVDFAGFNVSFDLKLLQAEMNRSRQPWSYEGAAILDAHRIYQINSPRTLSAAYREFCDKEPTGAHDAAYDVAITEEVLVAQLKAYPDIPRDVAALHTYCWPRPDNAIDRAGKIVWRGTDACLSFGKKFNGVPLRQVDRGYLQWILGQDFPKDTKRIVEDALSGAYPERSKR